MNDDNKQVIGLDEVKVVTGIPDNAGIDGFNRMLVAMNGDLFVANDAGEADEFVAKNAVFFPLSWPTDVKENVPMNPTVAQVTGFFAYNWSYLTNIIPEVNLRAKTVYLRFLAARLGLMHPNFNKANNRVRYNEAVWVTQDTVNSVDVGASSTAMVKAFDALPEAHRLGLQKQFTNLIGIVAIMFRSRGHHYLDEMADRYDSLWAKNRNAPQDLFKKNEWAHVATTAFHAIFPMILDRVLVNGAALGTLCNPFILRHDGPCAGTAVWYATYAGVANVQTIAGTKNRLLLGQIEILNRVMARLRADRWLGGINRNFYGAAQLDVDVKAIQELVAAVRGMVDPAEIQSTLKDSQALTRTAKQSPIVNAIWAALSHAILDAANSVEVRKPLGMKALTSVGFGDEATDTVGRNT